MGVCPARAQQPVAPQQVQQGTLAARSLRARAHWHQAVQVISRILRLRRRWAALGRYLQGQRIQDLVIGLERRQGQLVRRHPAPFAR